MRGIFILLVVIVTAGNAFAQKVDEVGDPSIQAKQIMISATSDGDLLAFFYDNGNVKIFDLKARKFKATLNDFPIAIYQFI